MTETTETTDEGVEITPTGLVHLIADGEHYWLRRPKIGELRDLEERVVAIAAMQVRVAKRTAEAVTEASEQPDDEAATAALNEATEAIAASDENLDRVKADLLAWWQDTVALLERSRRKLPADQDDLPPWLASFDLVTRTREAWHRVPWLAAQRP